MVLNSAKNRFDYDENNKISELDNGNIQLADDRKSLDSLNSSSQNQPLSTTETRVSSIRNSKDSSSFGNQSFLGDKIKPEINLSNINEDENDLQLQIKDSLKKLSEQYYMSPNEKIHPLFNYYCTPFLYNSNKKDFHFLNNIFKENNEKKRNYENDGKLYRKCPFEPCKEK